jgi:methylmalonyl-CoA mutase cobalamin-binding subunit
LGGDVEARNGQQSGCGDGFDVVHDASQLSKDAIVKAILQNSNESFVVCLYLNSI